jgi:hypothetical protein
MISQQELPTEFEKYYDPEGKLSEEDIQEEIKFVPTIEELLTFTPAEWAASYDPQFAVKDGAFDRSDVKTIFNNSARAFFIQDELDRDVAVYSLSREQQGDFVNAWLESQMDHLINGSFSDIGAIPLFADVLKEELENLIGRINRQGRLPTEEEHNEIFILSILSGYENIPFTDTDNEISKKASEKAYIAATLELEEKGETVIPSDSLILYLQTGERPEGYSTQELNNYRKDKIWETEAYKEFSNRLNDYKFSRNIQPDEDWSLDFKYHPVSLMIEAFEQGATVSRPFVNSIVVPILSRMVDTTVPDLSPVTDLANKGLDEIGVPDVDVLGVNVTRIPEPHKVARDIVEGKVTEEVLVELLNPANVLFVLPFIGPASRFGMAMKAGNKALAAAILADEFMLLGNTPGAIDGIMRLVTYTSRWGLKKTLLKFPAARNNKTFMGLVAGMEKKVARRDIEHEVQAISNANRGLMNENAVLQKMRTASIADARAQGMSDQQIMEIAGRYNRKLGDVPLRKFDPKILNKYGEKITREILTEGSTLGKGFKGGIEGQTVAEAKAIAEREGISTIEQRVAVEVDSLVDEMSNFDTALLSTRQGRQQRTDIQKKTIETIAYGSARDDPVLGETLSKEMVYAYGSRNTLPSGSHGFLTPEGKFIPLGDTAPDAAIREVWDNRIEDTIDLAKSTKASEDDVALAKVTRAMDETGNIAILRQGDDKIDVEAVRYIDRVQADTIKNMIVEQDIKDISFSFDSVHGIRAGERQTLYRGPTGKAFNDVLDDSTGVCSL